MVMQDHLYAHWLCVSWKCLGEKDSVCVMETRCLVRQDSATGYRKRGNGSLAQYLLHRLHMLFQAWKRLGIKLPLCCLQLRTMIWKLLQ